MRPSRAQLTKASASTSTTITEMTTQTQSQTIKGFTKVYSKKTDSQGIFKLQINLEKGEYTLKCNYGGDIEYGASSKTINLKVV